MARKCMTKTNRPVRRRATFQLNDHPGRSVILAGSFNQWQPEKKLEDKNQDGKYTATLMLEPGVYEYKFVVDGEWKLDENNPNFTPNHIGSLNSVLVIEDF